MEENTFKETSIRDLLRVVFRHKLIVVICLITIMIAAYIGLELRTPRYQASVKMLVAGKMQKDLEVERSLGPGSLMATHMSLVKSRPIIERTVQALKLYQRPVDYERQYASRIKRILIDYNTRRLKASIEEMKPERRRSFLFNKALVELENSISARPLLDTSIFLIVASDYNPVSAGIIANVISRSYVIFDLEQQIAELQLTYGNKNETIRKLENHIEKLQETLDGRILPNIEALGPASVKIIDQAGRGIMLQQKPSKAGGLVAAFVLSIVVGISLSFVYDFFDQTFKSPSDVENFLNIPYLGSIPKKKITEKLLIKHVNPDTRYTQSYKNLSNTIYLSMKDENIKTLLFTDTDGKDETDAIVANLGIYLSHRAHHNVLIIDANFRKAAISKVFNISESPGLADVLERKNNLEDAVQNLGSNLTVLPSGAAELNPVVLLESSMMSEILRQVNEIYEIILINCANIRNYSDAVILSSITDGIAFAINQGKVRRQVVKNAITPLEAKKIMVMGAVLNKHKYVIPEIVYKLT